jgi:hypothetical protein
MQVQWFGADVPIDFREPAFLTDPRLSPAIKHSWVRLRTPAMSANEARKALAPYEGARVIELSAMKDKFCGFEAPAEVASFAALARKLVPYSRHFCYEDGYRVPQEIPFYSPCCGTPPRAFPCKHLIAPPPTYADASKPPPFCEAKHAAQKVEALEVPADYPDMSPNPGSRQFHKVEDEFRKGFKRPTVGPQ